MQFSDASILNNVDSDVTWQYLLFQGDINNLKRWIIYEFDEKSKSEDITDYRQPSLSREDTIQSSPFDYFSQRSKSVESKSSVAVRSETRSIGMYGGTMYSSGSSGISSSPSDKGSAISSAASSRLDNVFKEHTVVWPREQFKPLTQSMIDLVVNAKFEICEIILNFLSGYGVFISQEKNDAKKLMKRLIISGNLDNINNFDNYGGENSCQLSQKEIHKLVTENLVSNDLKIAAYEYSNKFSTELEHQEEELLWPDLVRAYHLYEKDQNKDIILELCLENLRFMKSENVDKEKVILPAFLTLLFLPNMQLKDLIVLVKENHSEILNKKENKKLNDILTKFDLSISSVIDSVFMKYPYLEKTFRKSSQEDKLDVTVYDLLIDNVPYDVTGLFTWQRANRYENY